MRQLWQNSRVASPSSITEICFRVVNLRAALHRQEEGDDTKMNGKILLNMAVDIDNDLESWAAGLPDSWRYSVVHGPARVAEELLQGVRHVYPTLWIAEAWNNWRILRLLVSQMRLEISVDPQEIATSQNMARRLCTDVCISVSNFSGSPSKPPFCQVPGAFFSDTRFGYRLHIVDPTIVPRRPGNFGSVQFTGLCD